MVIIFIYLIFFFLYYYLIYFSIRERIGFQYNNPCTDINRSIKMFSVLQLLNLLETEEEFSREAYLLSESGLTPLTREELKLNKEKKDTSWPFFCVSLSFSKEVLILYEKNELTSICNKEKNIMKGLNYFYKKLFFYYIK